MCTHARLYCECLVTQHCPHFHRQNADSARLILDFECLQTSRRFLRFFLLCEYVMDYAVTLIVMVCPKCLSSAMVCPKCLSYAPTARDYAALLCPWSFLRENE